MTSSSGTGCCACIQGLFVVNKHFWVTDDVRSRLKRLNSEHPFNVADGKALKRKVGLTALLLRLDHKRTVDQYYEPVINRLGAGGQGTVSIRRQKETGEEFAVKLIPRTQVAREAAALRAELEVLLVLDHPHIVRLHEWFEDKLEGVHLVMDLCRGGTLEAYLSTDPAPSLGKMRQIFRELAQAISYCHGRGIVHRDLKLENVLLTLEGSVKLCDFGLCAIRSAGITGEWLEEQCGTAMYLAPEIIHSLPTVQPGSIVKVASGERDGKDEKDKTSPKYDEKCDIWSMGIILFAMLTVHYKGRTIHPYQPFNDEIRKLGFEFALWRRVLRQDPHWELVGNATEEERNLLKALLVKSPKNRISALEVLDSAWLKSHCGSSGQDAGAEISSNGRHPAAIPEATSGSLQKISSFAQLSHFEKAILTVVAHHAHENDMSELKDVFHEVDKDHSGLITHTELRECLTKCAILFEEQEFADLFKALDADGSGKIAYTEWLAATIGKDLVESEAAIDAAFQFFDLGGTGLIELHELEEILGSAEAASVLAEADLNGTGSIHRQAFGVFMKKLAAARDQKCNRFKAARNSEKSSTSNIEFMMSPQTLIGA